MNAIMTIPTDTSSYGDFATDRQAAAGMQWMREVARELGMEWLETNSDGELWATHDAREDSTDWGETAFDLWCRGRTPGSAAALIAEYRIVCREGGRILDSRLCWSYIEADIARCHLAAGSQYTIEHWHEPTRRWRNGMRLA